jgi:MinD-like ATPase involved in chromosome partitioning or flagellar assembly
VATGLAAELARRRNTTVLVDADPHGGSVAQVLGVLDEVSGLLAASRLVHSGELGERFASVQRALDPWLTVVTGLPRPDRWTEVRPGAIEALLEVAAEHAHVVVDAGFGLEDDAAGDYASRPGRAHVTRSAVSAADEVLVVGTPDPVGLSRLARALVELRETTGSVPTRVVVNRMRPSLGWSERDVADIVTAFARSVSLHFLPEDQVTVDRALVTGRTLAEIDPDSPLVRALGELADVVVPDPGNATRRGALVTRLRRRTTG